MNDDLNETLDEMAQLEREAEALLDVADTLPMKQLIRELKIAKERLAQAKAICSRWQSRFDVLRKIVIPRRMDTDDVENVRFAGIGSVQLRPDVYVHVPAHHQDDFFDWLRQRQHGDLITNGIHHARLKAYVKNALKEGEALPENLIKVTPYMYAIVSDK